LSLKVEMEKEGEGSTLRLHGVFDALCLTIASMGSIIAQNAGLEDLNRRNFSWRPINRPSMPPGYTSRGAGERSVTQELRNPELFACRRTAHGENSFLTRLQSHLTVPSLTRWLGYRARILHSTKSGRGRPRASKLRLSARSPMSLACVEAWLRIVLFPPSLSFHFLPLPALSPPSLPRADLDQEQNMQAFGPMPDLLVAPAKQLRLPVQFQTPGSKISG
jgi:hypothetical protein